MTRDKDKKPGKEQQLLEAARLGQLDQLETLLDQFQQLKTKRRSNPLASLRKCIGPNTARNPVTGFTCLHHAALNGHSQAVQVIVSYGGRLNAVDYKGSTALHLAAWSGNLQVVKTLISYGTTIKDQRTQTASNRSSSLAADAVSTFPLDGGQTTQAGAQPTCKQQQIKSSSSKRRNKHTTSQQQAASQSQDFTGDCLPDRQMLEINHRNNDNQTALSLAAQFGHSQVVAELLAGGADPNLRNNQLESPLDLACLNGHLDTVKVILNSLSSLVHDLRKPHSTISISTHPFSHTQLQQTSLEDSGPVQPVKPNPVTASGGWSSLLRGTTMKDLSSPTSDRRRATLAPGCSQQGASKQQMGSATFTSLNQHLVDSTLIERLLDHSPLHYAVRRAHTAIVDLLLNHYEANIYQLTSLGSVMHELVVGSQSLGNTPARGRSEFKHYPHSDIIRVFLIRLNQMSAGYLGETRTRWKHLLSARNGQQRTIFDMLNDIDNHTAQDLKIAISLDVSEHLQQTDLTHRSQQASQQQVFANTHHLNSFVTMKRAPKQQSSKSTRKRNDENEPIQNRQLQQGAIIPDGTQTIGRHKLSAKQRHESMVGHHQLSYVDYGGLARSISSLGHHNNNYAMTNGPNIERPSTINLPSLTMNQNQLNAQQFDRHNSQMPLGAVQEKRLKCRDSDATLKEISQNCGLSMLDQQEPLYDNQLMPSVDRQQLSSNQLVRSSTDCSHLLGHLFGQHEANRKQQQLALAHGGGRLSSDMEDKLQSAADRSIYNQHSHSSGSSSLISGLDQERLVPTSIAQQHSATLDRRAINRHYHVYEHEFYPPRLVATAAHHQIQGNKTAMSHHQASKQVVAIVPPLVHNQSLSIGADGQRAIDAKMANNSHPSSNMDCNISSHHRQSEQMNRFVDRLSRKSTGDQLGNIEQANQLNRPMVDMRPQSMHSSQSLENRLVASPQQALSFESTRQALMRDFDKMLGRELLNNPLCDTGASKYSDHSSDGGQSSHSRHMVNSNSSSSQNSILTGVSLDMDTRGEHLTVSGTRITLPEMQQQETSPSGATIMNQSISSGSVRLSVGSNRKVFSHEPSTAGTTTRMSSRLTQSGPSDNQSQSLLAQSSVEQNARREQPPEKPPRPSLESQQIYKASRMRGGPTTGDTKHQPSAGPLIYDVPSHNNSLSNLADTAPAPRRAMSRTSMNSSGSVALMVTPPSIRSAGPPARPPQPKPRRSASTGQDASYGVQEMSMTQAPSEKPPPPPPPAIFSSPLVTSPLEVITPANKRDWLNRPLGPSGSSLSSSSNSPTSSISSSLKTAPSKTVLAAQIHAEGQNAGLVTNAHGLIQAVEGGDSGLCTSNSPASTSHDSESGCRPSLELSFGSRIRTKSNHCSGSVTMAPPSPRTAQLSIEEAFMPLEETTTQEMSNQTSSVECSSGSDYDHNERQDDQAKSADEFCFEFDQEIQQATSIELGSQVDEIFSCLGVANKSPDLPAGTMKDGYENCTELQDRLRASRCRSIVNLFRGISSNLNESHGPGELELIPLPRACSSQNGNYATASDTQAYGDDQGLFLAESSSLILEAEQADNNSNTTNKSECTMTPRRQCKEILVRVVVDESQDDSNGEDIFYISPIELKKISSKVSMASESTNTIDTATKRLSEAETLTEEELCASVDNNSGYIRFTLRKRHAGSSTSNESQIVDPKEQPNLEPNQTPLTYDRLDSSSTSTKRTKINSDVEEVKETNKLPGESNETMQQVIEHEETRERVINTRKASGDSISMDTSQASTSSSSTSDMSIKSIVTLPVEQSDFRATDPKQVLHSIDQLDNKSTEPINVNVNLNISDGIGPRERTPTPRPASVAQPLSAQPQDQVAFDEKKNDKPEQVRVAPKVTTSLVSETARRLEAAAAARAANGSAPAAAVRRTLNRKSQNEDQLESKRDGSKPPTLPPKKSICWPPKKSLDDIEEKIVIDTKKVVIATENDEILPIKTTTSTPTGPVIGRVSANRLSFQRLIEEKSRAANNTLNRPKPPPPIKPAGLIGNGGHKLSRAESSARESHNKSDKCP